MIMMMINTSSEPQETVLESDVSGGYAGFPEFASHSSVRAIHFHVQVEPHEGPIHRLGSPNINCFHDSLLRGFTR
jgi:hypothetical protein